MANTAYTIFSSLGKEYIVDENTTNRDTSISLIGHNLPDYGEEQNTNFLHLLENFYSDKEPNNPIIGQLWYKKIDNNGSLYICSNNEEIAQWKKICSIQFENNNLVNENGDFYYDKDSQTLYIYDNESNNKWVEVGNKKIEYKDNKFISSFLEDGQTLSLNISKNDFKKDISVCSSESSTGSLYMIQMTILAKEHNETSEQRSCGWLYKFIVRCKKIYLTDTYEVSIIGNPSYELIGKTDDTDWTINITENSNDINILFDKGSSSYIGGSVIDVGCYYDIIRI